METYAEEKGLVSLPRKMLITIFILEKATLITPLLLIYLQLRLVVTKLHSCLDCTRTNCFNSFVQSAVDERRKSDEHPNSSVVAETIKLLTNGSPSYQIVDRSQHTITKYLSDKKTFAAIDSKLFKNLDHVNNS